jgi:hypothetical protein
MGSDLKKFVNPKFLKTIDLSLIKVLFARHYEPKDVPIDFDDEDSAVRSALAKHFEAALTAWNEGMVADLHRVADLGSNEGMQIILNEARRQGVVLYPDPEPDETESAPARHDPKHVALHTLPASQERLRGGCRRPGPADPDSTGRVPRAGAGRQRRPDTGDHRGFQGRGDETLRARSPG